MVAAMQQMQRLSVVGRLNRQSAIVRPVSNEMLMIANAEMRRCSVVAKKPNACRLNKPTESASNVNAPRRLNVRLKPVGKQTGMRVRSNPFRIVGSSNGLWHRRHHHRLHRRSHLLRRRLHHRRRVCSVQKRANSSGSSAICRKTTNAADLLIPRSAYRC